MAIESKHGSVSEHELAELRSLIQSRSGILFDSSRQRFFSARVGEHIEAKRLGNGSELVRLLKTSNAEYDGFLQRMLTQETSFFRYPNVFGAFERKVLPELHMKKFWETPRNLRIWSAGCSTGEEPYTIAICLAETLEFPEAWNIHLLATDISREALDHAERGVYSQRDMLGLTAEQIEQYFTREGREFRVKPRIRNMVQFAPMNLAQPVYMGRFDCIFCMNVMIYFSEELRSQLIQRFFDCLEPGGYLFLGHAESAVNVPVRFETHVIGDSRIYQKPQGVGSSRAAAVSGSEI
jgi:chemotaxis protein methyltransferase CheR